MQIPFEKLSDEAHIWIYQGNRTLDQEATTPILDIVASFLATWSPHGKVLQCGTTILHNRFLVLAVEKCNQPLSCCTVDTTIQLMNDLERKFHINFLDKTAVIFKNGNTLIEVNIDQMKLAIAQKKITNNIFVFDPTIRYKKALQDKFLVPVKDTWVNKYFE